MSEPRGRRNDALTELVRTVQPWETDIPVRSTAPLSESGRVVIRGEFIRYASSDADWLYGCERGVDQTEGGSEAKRHPGGAFVRQANPDDILVTQDGEPASARPRFNFVPTGKVTLSVADNAAEERSDITINVDEDDWMLIDSNAFVAQSSITVDDVFTSSYRSYRIVIDIDAATAATGLNLVLRDTTPANITTGYERPMLSMVSSSNTASGSSVTNGSNWVVMTLINGAVDGTVTINLSSPRDELKTRGTFLTSSLNTATTTYQGLLGWLGTRFTTAAQGFQIQAGSGTITGRYAVYALRM